jgi:hypothetical protein
MISVLIPVHNYLIQHLVNGLYKQLQLLQIDWELLISDDASEEKFKKQNIEFISSLSSENIKFFSQKNNIGNAANRNFLGTNASHKWLLFLDADTLPVYQNFIQLYLNRMQTTEKSIISGNVIYKSDGNKSLLRWKYGKKKEELTLKKRKKNPKLTARGANFAIKKDVFIHNKFYLLKEKYGFVDTRFFLQFNSNQFDLIENPVYHLGLESNKVYLEKIKNAVANALFLLKSNDEVSKEITLIGFYKKVRFCKRFFSFLFTILKGVLEKNLISDTPLIFNLQLFKLLYISKLDSFKKI